MRGGIVAVLAGIILVAGCSSYDPKVVSEYRSSARSLYDCYVGAERKGDYYGKQLYQESMNDIGLPYWSDDKMIELLDMTDAELGAWMKENGIHKKASD